VQADVELLQLAFNSTTTSPPEYVDTGVWMNLGSGKIQVTRLPPVQSRKYIRATTASSRSHRSRVVRLSGDANPRIRWEG